jgi:hypothetical protein
MFQTFPECILKADARLVQLASDAMSSRPVFAPVATTARTPLVRFQGRYARALHERS